MSTEKKIKPRLPRSVFNKKTGETIYTLQVSIADSYCEYTYEFTGGRAGHVSIEQVAQAIGRYVKIKPKEIGQRR